MKQKSYAAKYNECKTRYACARSGIARPYCDVMHHKNGSGVARQGQARPDYDYKCIYIYIYTYVRHGPTRYVRHGPRMHTER